MRWLAGALLTVLAVGPAWADRTVPAAQALERVEHHVREVDALAAHFEVVLNEPCPHFPTTAQWDAYLEYEVDRLVLLLAHLEQAWVEAKTTGDDSVRQAAKAPRRRVREARALVDKFQDCARDNGVELAPLDLWARIEAAVPRRQTEIALPAP